MLQRITFLSFYSLHFWPYSCLRSSYPLLACWTLVFLRRSRLVSGVHPSLWRKEPPTNHMFILAGSHLKKNWPSCAQHILYNWAFETNPPKVFPDFGNDGSQAVFMRLAYEEEFYLYFIRHQLYTPKKGSRDCQWWRYKLVKISNYIRQRESL